MFNGKINGYKFIVFRIYDGQIAVCRAPNGQNKYYWDEVSEEFLAYNMGGAMTIDNEVIARAGLTNLTANSSFAIQAISQNLITFRIDPV